MGYVMKKGTRFINVNNSKWISFVKKDKTHVWFIIDGIEECLLTETFNKTYKEV